MNCWNLQSAFEHERADCIYLRKYTLVSLHVDHVAPLLHLEFSMAAYCPPCLVQVPGFHVWRAPNHLPFSESIHKNSRPKVSSIATTRPKKVTKWRCFWNLAISTNLDHPGFQGSSVTSRSLDGTRFLSYHLGVTNLHGWASREHLLKDTPPR